MAFPLRTIKKALLQYLLLVLCTAFFLTACKKDSFITSKDALITTSADSLKFDTVFTSIGSVTQTLKINNPNNQKLLLSSVKLMGGSSSPFQININGKATQEATNIEIAAEDSIYVFVSVTINPGTANLPFIVKDSIGIDFNGNKRFIQLEAFGQNANFLRNTVITEDRTWSNSLPYVLLGPVRVDTNVTLTLEPGCKIYANATAPFIVDGTVISSGTKEEPVIFTGNRLDDEYRNLPASWPGIYCRATSKNNVFTYTSIKNAYQALVAESPASNSNPKVTLHQCIIDNAYDAGLLCVASSLFADNSLISNCGSNINFTLGGSYLLINCSAAAYTNYVNHKKPVLAMNNFYSFNGNQLTNALEANFVNCIFWGEEGQVKDEVTVDKQGSDPFTVSFSNCLYRNATEPPNTALKDNIVNIAPGFDNIDAGKRLFDFHISNPSAPGVNKGLPVIFTKDLDGNNRSNGLPDIGCYEQF